MNGDGGSLVPRKTISAVIMLTAVFTVLKLTGVTGGWPWWLVLFPLWASGSVTAGAFAALAIAYAIRYWPPS